MAFDVFVAGRDPLPSEEPTKESKPTTNKEEE